MDYLASYQSPLGLITMASDGEALVGLWFEGQKHFESTLGETQQRSEVPVFAEAHAWLDRYFKGIDPGPAPALAPRGTPFRQQVWSALLEVPYGTLSTYGELGKTLEAATGKRTSARAVGGAVGHNPLSLMVPCHRIVGATGSLTGYAGGLHRKIALLQLEGIALDNLKIPTTGTAL